MVRPLFVLALAALAAPAAPAADWIHWRGPEQNGVSREKLPDTFDLAAPGKGNLMWQVPFGGRSSPLVMNGRVYTISGYDPTLVSEGERVMCFDEATGKTLWEKRFSVFHTDIVSSRLGWTTLTADPAKEFVYAHATAGTLYCFDKDGKIVWQRQLTEEFGRVSGYGGRIVSPIFDGGLVIMGLLNASWGDFGRGGNRFVAFDGATGKVVWWADTTLPVKSTYTSSPVIAVINGQRVLVSGGGDGAIHGIHVRTGKLLWSIPITGGAVNPTPIVDGNLIYAAHGESNLGGGPEGMVACFDAGQIDPATKRPKKVWEFRRASRFGLASPALADGRLYVPEDGGELFCFEAKKGKLLWRAKYGTVARGSPLVCGDKLFIFDVFAKLAVFKLNGDAEPTEDNEYTFKAKTGTALVETHGSPIAVNGKLFFLTRDDLYCIGAANPAAPAAVAYKQLAPEKSAEGVAGIRVFPADLVAKPGDDVSFDIKFLDANGNVVPAPADAKIEWSLPTPPVPMGATTGPPPLKGEVKPDGATAHVVLDKMPSQQGYVLAKVGPMTARARLRVVPQIPYANDFEKVPLGAAPGGWVNAQGKFTVKELAGSKVLSKVNTNPSPLVARANGYATLPTTANYAIECDVMGTQVRGKLPDMGVVNSRYTLILDGKNDPVTNKRSLRLVSWEAMPRVNKSFTLDWDEAIWYRLKLSAETAGGKTTVRGKVWRLEVAEPKAWNIEYDDPNPNTEGAAGLYGYVSNVGGVEAPGSDIFYDNLKITPLGKN